MIKVVIMICIAVILGLAAGLSIYSLIYVLKLRKFIEGIDFRTATLSLDNFHNITINVQKPLTEENVCKLAEALEKKPGIIAKFFFGDGSQLHITKRTNGNNFRDPFLE